MSLWAGFHIHFNCCPRVRSSQIFRENVQGLGMVGIRERETYTAFGGDHFCSDLRMEMVNAIGFDRDIFQRLTQIKIHSSIENQKDGAPAPGRRNGVITNRNSHRVAPSPVQPSLEEIPRKISIPDQGMI